MALDWLYSTIHDGIPYIKCIILVRVRVFFARPISFAIILKNDQHLIVLRCAIDIYEANIEWLRKRGRE